MFLKFSLMVSLMVTLMMKHVSSPFIMCLMVVMVAGSSCSLVSLLCPLWISYALVIIFLGGMMVLFTYASSISVSDKIIKGGNPLLGMTFILLFLFMVIPLNKSVFMGSFFFGLGGVSLVLFTLYLLSSLVLVIKLVEISGGALIS